MLQTIRDKLSGGFAVVVLGLIILTMAFFGVESYFAPKLETFAAKIEGPAKFMGFGGQKVEISQDEFRKRLDQVRGQQRQEQGEAFDAQAFESLDNKREILDGMVDEQVASLAAKRDGISVSKQAIQKEILGIEAFLVDGKFDQDRYRFALQAQGYSPLSFEQLVRDDLIRQAVSKEIATSALASDTELDAYTRLSRQTRDLQWLDLPTPSLPAEPPSEAELKAWHESHSGSYQRAETVAIEYLELDASALPQATTVDEATLQARYQEQKARYVTEPQYLVSHLLVAVPANADAPAEAAARDKAAALAAQASQAGADFAALARDNSDDLGSKADGGDLGAIEKGLFDPAFEKAAFALKAGEVSEPVRGAEGWHVIKLREILAGSERPFEEVRAELEQEVLETEHERAFSELSGKLMDLVYKDPTTLAPAAKELGLAVQTSTAFTRTEGEGIAALEPVRRAAFADAQKLEGQASEAIELGPNHLVVLRVTEHVPAATLPLSEVRERVLADFNRDRLQALAKEQAKALLARANKGETLEALSTELGRAVQTRAGVARFARDLPVSLVNEAFRLARPKAGETAQVALAQVGGDRFALVAVSAVTDGDTASLDQDTRSMLRSQLARARGVVEARAYLQALRKQYTVTVAEDRL